jgi:hypothetical protein
MVPTANFDFHQLRDDDHCKGNFGCIIYNTDGSSSWTAQDTGLRPPKPKLTLMACMGMLHKVLDHEVSTLLLNVLET